MLHHNVTFCSISLSYIQLAGLLKIGLHSLRAIGIGRFQAIRAQYNLDRSRKDSLQEIHILKLLNVAQEVPSRSIVSISSFLGLSTD